MNMLERWSAGWNRFWFGPIDPINIGIFRVFFGGVLTLYYAVRLVDFRFLFSNEGIVPYRLLGQVTLEDYRSPIPWAALAANDRVAFALHVLLVIGMFAITVGWIRRPLAWIVMILHLIFFQRNPLVVYGADLAATSWLLYLCLTDTRDFLKRRATDPMTTVGIRLIQLQLCSIYGNSGLDKLKGMSWWRGDSLWHAFSNAQLVSWDLGFLAKVPIVMIFVVYSTLLFEVYFPLAVWPKAVRPWVLGFGVLLHLGIAVLMHLPFFACIMLAPYLLFLDPNTLRYAYGRIAERLPKQLTSRDRPTYS